MIVIFFLMKHPFICDFSNICLEEGTYIEPFELLPLLKLLPLQEISVDLTFRIDDLEDAVNINERLNQQLHQKDERMAVLQAK